MVEATSPKQAAGYAAAKLVKTGMKLGLGTGTTVAFFLQALAERIKQEGLEVVGVATSVQTAELARTLGIPISDLDHYPALDLVIDGADEVDSKFRLIKGGGGRINDKAISDETHPVTAADLNAEGLVKLSAGRKRHALLRVS